MKYLFWAVCFSYVSSCLGQVVTGSELLDKAIAYHDPNNQWNSFKADFRVTMESPKGDKRVSLIAMDLTSSNFRLITQKEDNTIEQTVHKGQCILKLNGKTNITDADRASYNISCERAKKMRDYYTYLYGLPMKLRDPGTIVHPTVQLKKFKEKEHLTLKVTYSPEVGKDTWYFYFDPTTFALEVYQFFHDESKNDGEYILLAGEENIRGIKMPKTRSWFYNKNDQLLGTDVLSKNPL
jgi:hypothetical protein